MADKYDRAHATATRMLKPRSVGGSGLEMQLIKIETGEYDPETGEAPVVTTIYEGSAFRDPYKKGEIDGTRVIVNDVKFLVSPTLLDGSAIPAIDPQYKMIFDGSEYTIISVEPWSYAGMVVGLEVQGRL